MSEGEMSHSNADERVENKQGGSVDLATVDLAIADPTRAVRVLAGKPNAEELAALVVVLAAASQGGENEPEKPAQLWARPAHVRRRFPRSWAESRLPR